MCQHRGAAIECPVCHLVASVSVAKADHDAPGDHLCDCGSRTVTLWSESDNLYYVRQCSHPLDVDRTGCNVDVSAWAVTEPRAFEVHAEYAGLRRTPHVGEVDDGCEPWFVAIQRARDQSREPGSHSVRCQ